MQNNKFLIRSAKQAKEINIQDVNVEMWISSRRVFFLRDLTPAKATLLFGKGHFINRNGVPTTCIRLALGCNKQVIVGIGDLHTNRK
jgi:hypothetical protein